LLNNAPKNWKSASGVEIYYFDPKTKNISDIGFLIQMGIITPREFLTLDSYPHL